MKRRQELILKLFNQLDEDNQTVILAEAHELLSAQKLREKHLRQEKKAQLVSFSNRS